jgi:hypothetical protein
MGHGTDDKPNRGKVRANLSRQQFRIRKRSTNCRTAARIETDPLFNLSTLRLTRLGMQPAVDTTEEVEGAAKRSSHKLQRGL